MGVAKVNGATVQSQCIKRMEALPRTFTAAEPLVIDGVARHVADVVAIYQRDLDMRKAVQVAYAALKLAYADRQRAGAERRTLDMALRALVVGRFGKGSAQAMDFGFVPNSRQRPTAKTKARATDLAKATRKARNTMGSRQRAHIKGVLTPDAASSAPVVSTVEAPAPVATASGSGTAGTGGGTPPR